jgi:plasmid stabilization system protein ParE
MVEYAFHPDALLEYAEATNYYLRTASPEIAERFVTLVESAIKAILAAPDRWTVVEKPGTRRYLLNRFPYLLYYRWDAGKKLVTILAVMHCSREPAYWRERSGT